MKRSEIEGLLPGVFQRTLRNDDSAAPRSGNVLDALLDVMEALPAPSAAVLKGLDTTFDPRRTADEFVPYLAGWVGLDRLFDPGSSVARRGHSRAPFSTGLGRLRELTASAAWLSKWRGTAPGLRRFLPIATGETAIQVDDHVDRKGKQRLFHFTVRVPAGLKPHRALIERIIESEKPAYTTYELVW
jgi:phage tail-like protein